MSNIKEQIRLPFSVALEVVLQGLRIRLGRSIVTLTGIMLGVAFLMSVLTANSIRAGVGEEKAARQDTERMVGFLTAATGPLRGRSVAVLAETFPNDAELRLLKAIESADVATIRWFGDKSTIPDGLRPAVSAGGAAEAGADASGVLLIGGFTSIAKIQEALVSARQPVVATVSKLAPVAGSRVILLGRIPVDGGQADAGASRDRARSIWIITIALLVTMICISNSLLMSVTERFKEIGTMKCLGALSSFIRRVYFIESSLLGILGSLGGAVMGLLFAIVMYGLTYGFGLTLVALAPGPTAGLFILSVTGGVAVSILAAIYPANFASRMVPATALRTNI